MKDADGIILATTIEWLGIGGYMQQFLDACWLYGDKEKIKRLICSRLSCLQHMESARAN